MSHKRTYSLKPFLLFFVCILVQSFVSRAQFSWSSQNSGLVSEVIKDVFFLNINKGWAVGQNGKILHTTNGGFTWVQLSSPVSVNLHGICMSSNTTGWIAGDDETLLKTTDGGNTWGIAPQPSGTSSHLYDVQFTDENHGWILGFWDSFKTVDGGNTWTAFDPAGGTTMTDLHFINNTKGWICGAGGYLGYTGDGGDTWTQVSTPGTGEIYAVYVHSANEITIAGDSGYIHKTYNGGIDWLVVNSAAPGAIIDLDFMTPEAGVAVGNSGTVLSTLDGGVLWSTNTFTSVDLTSVDMVSGGIGWIGGYAGSVYKSAYGLNDLSIFAYHGLDTLCADIKTDVILTVYNAGPAPVEALDIILLDNGTPFHNYHWSGFMGANSYMDVNLGQASVDHTDTYTGIIYGDSVQANNISSKYIVVYPNPVFVNSPVTICSGDSAEIEVNGGYAYDWDNASADSANAVQVVSPVETQYYYVNVKTEHCAVLDSVNVIVKDCSDPITAITPNDDGKNDFLVIADVSNPDNSLEIYNRWGDLVNSFTGYDNETVIFDGKDSYGNPLTEGTYFYIFETSDQGTRFSSWVQIIR